eukprot:TRINITY_DN104366_c0_g1_i1.p1 TRINITY_DN104366_c0_g1~~TRINITY_DN104366_c0_g1_i1.p1  ORF type:complete len:649 (-),score=104.21 TRINITY_DN104366_c0_g1_i1:66-2012(-)
MGNSTACLEQGRGWLPDNLQGSLCLGGHKGFPPFSAPNEGEHVVYAFDFAAEAGSDKSKLWPGAQGSVTARRGYQLGETLPDRRAVRWEAVHEYKEAASELSICVSGRLCIRCPGKLRLADGGAAPGATAFRLCTRGGPVFESVRTASFTHTAHVVTSGIYFCLGLQGTSTGTMLCPRIFLLLSNGDEVPLVEDRLGPLENTHNFFLDFSVIDKAGNSVQMDLIFRGSPASLVSSNGNDSLESSGQSGSWTLRTCLQEHCTFNSQVKPGSVCLASSELGALVQDSSAFLQHLVVSEEHLEQAPQSSGSSQQSSPWWLEKDARCRLLFEGLQSQRRREADSRQGAWRNSCVEDFWHHNRYGNTPTSSKSPRAPANPGLQGEFWLTRDTVEKKHLYLSYSASLAQALSTCVILRYTCLMDFITLIENQVPDVKEQHIPSNGIVLGLEQDPRHPGLVRMFMEHRNEIIEDRVLCELDAAQALHMQAVQEVYDGGDSISFKVTLRHSDGSFQSSMLELQLDQLDADTIPGRACRQFDEPSWRFPIVPSRKSHVMSPGSRILVYSSVAHEPPPAPDASGFYSAGEESAPEDMRGANATPPPDMHMAEEWQSAGGGNSDCEEALPDSRDDPPPRASALVESVVVLSGVQERPFS